MLKYGAALELHAPPRVLDVRTTLFFTRPPLPRHASVPLLPAYTSPPIGNEFWQFCRARLNTMGGVTTGIKNKKRRKTARWQFRDDSFFSRFDARYAAEFAGVSERRLCVDGLRENKLRETRRRASTTDRDKACAPFLHLSSVLLVTRYSTAKQTACK